MEVIQYVDPTGHTMVARYPSKGTAAIQLGSQLIVEESQQAVFLRDGKALDTFLPGRHTLATANLPLLARLFGIPFEGKSPFQAAVIFVSTKTFLDLKWGTKEPVVYRDSELAMVRLRAFGKFAVRIANAQQFVNEIVGTQGIYTTDGVETWFKDVIVARLTDLLGENLSSIFDLPKVYDELGMGLKGRVADDFGKYGIELVDLYLGAITPPPEVQKLIDERTGMAALGDMNAYMKFKAAKAMGDAAQQSGGETGSGVGAGLGVGMGAGMGMMLPQMMKEAMQGGGAPQGSGGAPAGGAPAQQAAAGAAAAGGAVAGEAETGEDAAAGGEAEAGSPAFCHQCGGKLPGGARFCPSCGTKVGG
ncbi:MAG: SPFH domain-containing protein [Thermoanaerobaculia bacterium]|nr:SPFH domain-containing protein [Thermoanaerobaculia bacterium]